MSRQTVLDPANQTLDSAKKTNESANDAANGQTGEAVEQKLKSATPEADKLETAAFKFGKHPGKKSKGKTQTAPKIQAEAIGAA